MKRVPVFLTAMVLLLAGCARTWAPDIASTVHAAVASTLAARPAEILVPIPTVTPSRTPTRPARPIPTSPPYTHTLATYQGRGFSFQYPAGARLDRGPPRRMAWQRVSPATDEIHIMGPQVWIQAGDADWGYRGPAYELVVRTYDNPQGQDVESWVRNFILTSWREARARSRPWGSLPVSKEGEIDERKVERVVVAGQPSFLVWFYTFDSTTPAYYLVTDRQIVELSFRLYPVANQPLAMVQRDVYALILGTFHLEVGEAVLR